MEEKERFELIGYCSYRDTETGVIGDNFVGVLNEQDKKIKDLETKLAESENKVKGFVELFDKKQHENYEQFCEIMQLKQQLALTEKAFDLMSIVLCTGARDDLKRQLGRFTLRQEVKDFFLKQAEQEVENE